MNEAELNQQIDDYLLNRLNKQERQSFTERLSKDQSLQGSVQVRQLLIEQIKTIGNLQLKEKILKIQSKVEFKKQKQSRRRLIGWIVGVAAVILFLSLSHFIGQTSSPQSLYAQYYKTYQLPFGSRSTSEADLLLQNAGGLYLQGEYTQALSLFEQIKATGDLDDRGQLAMAICYMELEKYQEAEKQLSNYTAQDAPLYLDQAQWYLALTYLQLGKIDQSKTLLELLKGNTAAFFQESATNLLDQLAKI